MAVDEQRLAVGVAARDAGDGRGSAGFGFKNRGLDAHFVQLLSHPFRGGSLGMRRVGRVDPDQVRQQRYDLIAGGSWGSRLTHGSFLPVFDVPFVVG